ncbi:mono/diheme cytochrome c family protein [Marinobacter pelagius]|uniref:Mono/diheme cytochrome c family protein n=2 Tax=Marinobacter pelagius TaxID=379482 RepID=A0A366GPI9_9GAMM|nr:mono/diheme cytochrome c family protein [Marinobacter pelagius]
MVICSPVTLLANGHLFMNKWVASLVLFAAPVAGMTSGGSATSESVPAKLAEGRQVYEQSCASCHGWQGEGAANWQKPDEAGERPPPPHDETGHIWRHSDAMLFRMIAEGWRHPFNKTDRLTMPAFRDTLTDQEIQAVIEYLKTFWDEDQRRYQLEESQNATEPEGSS